MIERRSSGWRRAPGLAGRPVLRVAWPRGGDVPRAANPRGSRLSRVTSTHRSSRGSQATPEPLQPTLSGLDDLAVLPGAQPDCDCPACLGEVDFDQVFLDMLNGVEQLADSEDPLNAELLGAGLTALVTTAGEKTVSAFVQMVVPRLEAAADTRALALLTAIGAVASDAGRPVAAAAAAAAARMAEAGVPRPRWADGLAEPVRVGECLRLHDSEESVSVLVASFERAGRGHAFLVVVDQHDCGSAAEILVVDGDQLAQCARRHPGGRLRRSGGPADPDA